MVIAEKFCRVQTPQKCLRARKTKRSMYKKQASLSLFSQIHLNHLLGLRCAIKALIGLNFFIMKIFDVIVVGKGLVGSAAAKYLSVTHSNIAIVGPDEPINYDDAIVFASHYDQARVQRIIGKDEVWTRLNLDSVLQYDEIQKQTNIKFHEPTGCLYVNPYGSDDYLINASFLSENFHLTTHFINTPEEFNKVYENFNLPSTSMGLMETGPAGFINPAKLVEAQLLLCKNNGVEIFKDTIVQIKKGVDEFILTTSFGEQMFAKKVLVATGSFLNVTDLLPQQVQLKTKNEVVLLVNIEEQHLDQFSNMPSLLYEKNEEGVDGIYVLKPVKYPDGNYYLKIGCNMPNDFYFDSLEQIQYWFKKADTTPFEQYLLKEIQLLFPSLVITKYQLKKCIISRTSHGRPIIGETAQKGLYLSGGCNGYSAMCSDALGKVTSHYIMSGQFPEGYSSHAFEIKYV